MNYEALGDIITQYKKSFEIHRPEELYKWEAVKCFHDNWDIDAEVFPMMLRQALGKNATLMLDSMSSFPRSMICRMADADPEAVRKMFIDLKDTTSPITGRIAQFAERAEDLRSKFNPGSWNNHYQTPTSICTYLFFLNPEECYIYKFRKYKTFAQKVFYQKLPRTSDPNSVLDYFQMCDEILDFVKHDKELLEMSMKSLNENPKVFYQDQHYHLLTDDIAFFGSRSDIITSVWWPSEHDYHPGISEDVWLQLLENTQVFNDNSLTIMKRFLAFGGEATCTQLSQKYGESANFYNSGSTALAKRVAKEESCKLLEDNNDSARWWPVLYVGRYTNKGESGAYKWKLRSELKSALERFDLPGIPLESPARTGSSVGIGITTTKDVFNPADTMYSTQDFLNEVYMDENDYESLKSLLEHKLNVIIQGPPGVGKTFAAKRVAYSMIGKKDDSRVKVIQFHQNYTYEDFIEGYKPVKDGFELQHGAFYRFCKYAEEREKGKTEEEKDKYFLIIDEINRGNLSKIFGELLMMIEKDYRNEKIDLAYSKEPFYVPSNLYIIGMMNTADRSLALIDYALRRRFAFYDMHPAFDKEGFIAYRDSLENELFNNFIKKIIELNKVISDDLSLGDGFRIGHSYFCGKKESTKDWLNEVVEYDIIPMLKEYWFDDKTKVKNWEQELTGVLNAE